MRYVADDVVDRLVTAVGLGVYVDGQQLPTERELAAMLGVSRTSVRDALKQLTASGYLEVRRGRKGGYFVLSDWGPDLAHHVRRQLVARWSEFEHVFDARTLVEPMIARTAAARRSKDDIVAMKAAVQAYVDAADRDASRVADTALHLAIAEATHNPILVACRSTCAPRSRSTSAPNRTPTKRGGPRSSSTRNSSRRSSRAAATTRRRLPHGTSRFRKNLIRKLVDRAEHDARKSRSAMMSRQLVFVVRRLLLTIPMLFVMSVVVFLIIRLVPGDPVRTMLGFRATDENVAELRRQLGLDRPLLEQYLNWAGALLRGDLGKDIVSHAPLSRICCANACR